MGREKGGDRLNAAGLAVAGSAAAAGMSWAVRGRSSSLFGPSVWTGRPGRRAVALTFDDGPGPGTAAMLDILSQYDAKATFFQCGMNVLRAPDLARGVAAEGHEIGNHSFTHANCALRSSRFIHDEFARTQDVLSETTGRAPRLMRAPFGVRWFGFRRMQARLGLTGVMWTVIGRDWTLPAPAIAARVLAAARDGAIICLHDGRGTLKSPDVTASIEAVRRIVPELIEKGYHFEAVSELLCPINR